MAVVMQLLTLKISVFYAQCNYDNKQRLFPSSIKRMFTYY